MAEHGGPGQYESTDVYGSEARAFWRRMREQHGIVLVGPSGRPIAIED